jgi:hypothetical protein
LECAVRKGIEALLSTPIMHHLRIAACKIPDGEADSVLAQLNAKERNVRFSVPMNDIDGKALSSA